MRYNTEDIDKCHMFSLIYGKTNKKAIDSSRRKLLRIRKDVGVLAARAEEWVNMII